MGGAFQAISPIQSANQTPTVALVIPGAPVVTSLVATSVPNTPMPTISEIAATPTLETKLQITSSSASTIPALITNVSRFATGYTLTLNVESLPVEVGQTNMDVRTTALSVLTNEASTQFVRQSSGGYFGQVIVALEFIGDEDISWIRNHITVEILLDN